MERRKKQPRGSQFNVAWNSLLSTLLRRNAFYQFQATRKTNADSQLVRKDMNINEHERLSNFTLRNKLK